MELRHLRYFVTVASELSFIGAARRLRVSQPALSKQIQDLERELGVTLFVRIPRGVRLTAAGEAFLTDAHATLAMAARAVASARRSHDSKLTTFTFCHGEEMGVWTPVVANLLAAFCRAYPEIDVQVSMQNQMEQLAGVRSGLFDVGATFLPSWPPAEFGAHRLMDCSLTGAMIPASHPLANCPRIHLRDLAPLTLLHRSGKSWPASFRKFRQALHERGLGPDGFREQALDAPSGVVQIAAGHAWSLANPMIATAYDEMQSSIVYRPFVEPPIPSWLALIWPGQPTPLVRCLLDVAAAALPEMADERAGTQASRAKAS